jgi:predicted transcriptional regulator
MKVTMSLSVAPEIATEIQKLARQREVSYQAIMREVMEAGINSLKEADRCADQTAEPVNVS